MPHIMSAQAWLLLLCLSFIWGASFYFVEIGLAYLDPFWVVSLRLCSGAAALYLWFRSRGLRLPASGRFWLMALVMGALNNVIPFTLIAWGQQFVTGGLASIVNANTAFISVIVSGLFVASEPARWNRIAGVLIGVLGVAIAIGLGNPDTGRNEASELLGGAAIILATVSYALAAVWGRLKLDRYRPVEGAMGMLVCSSLLSLVMSCLVSGAPDIRIMHHAFDAMQLLVGLGIFGTALAYLLYFRILQLAGSSNLMLVTIIVPVFAVALDAAILGQFVTARNLLGFAVVACGLMVMDGRLLGKLKPGGPG